MEQLAHEPPADHDLAFDWSWDGDETDEESKIRAEAPQDHGAARPADQATTVRVPVLVGHSQAVWIETEEPLTPAQAAALLEAAPSVRLVDLPTSARRAESKTSSSAASAPTRQSTAAASSSSSPATTSSRAPR